MPNVCFGYQIKSVRGNGEIIRIDNKIYNRFLAPDTYFRWLEKEMRDALDNEL